MISPIIELKIRCPLCGRSVTPVTAYSAAVDVVRRRCHSGHRWVVKIEPITFTPERAAHKLTWTPLDPWSAANDKAVQAAAKEEARHAG